MKKQLLLPVLFFFYYHTAAQTSVKKLHLELGGPFRTASENLGVFLNAEPKTLAFENAYVGIRIAVAINSQSFQNDDRTQFVMREDYSHGFFSVVPTFDYYWPQETIQPYLGIGIGPYSISNFIDVSGINTNDPNERSFDVEVGYRIGWLLRGGLEFKKLRAGLEFNLVPKTAIKAPNSKTKIGTVNSSYCGLSLGYILSE